MDRRRRASLTIVAAAWIASWLQPTSALGAPFSPPAPAPILAIPPSVLPPVPPEEIAEARARGEKWLAHASPPCMADVARHLETKSLQPVTRETYVIVVGHEIRRLEYNEAALADARNSPDQDRYPRAVAMLRYVYDDIESTYPHCNLFDHRQLDLGP